MSSAADDRRGEMPPRLTTEAHLAALRRQPAHRQGKRSIDDTQAMEIYMQAHGGGREGAGERYLTVARQFGVSFWVVRQIAEGRHYREVARAAQEVARAAVPDEAEREIPACPTSALWRWAAPENILSMVMLPSPLGHTAMDRLRAALGKGLIVRSALAIALLVLLPAGAWGAPINIPLLRDCIEPIESAGEPYPDGAVRIETLPDGTQTISRGRYQIAETTLHQFFPAIHASWLAQPDMARQIMDDLLRKYLEWFPKATPKRLAYAHFAGPGARPYWRKSKERLAVRVANCYSLKG